MCFLNARVSWFIEGLLVEKQADASTRRVFQRKRFAAEWISRNIEIMQQARGPGLQFGTPAAVTTR